MKKIMFIPVLLFVFLLIFLAIGLSLDPKLVPSPLIGNPIPSFSAELLLNPNKMVRPEELRGNPFLLNVWASWCSACRLEHPLLLKIADEDELPIIGLNYKDRRVNSVKWLNHFGNPYEFSLFDSKGKVGMDLGVYGVPETFLIDANGIVIYKHVGPLDENIFRTEFLPRISD